MFRLLMIVTGLAVTGCGQESIKNQRSDVEEAFAVGSEGVDAEAYKGGRRRGGKRGRRGRGGRRGNNPSINVSNPAPNPAPHSGGSMRTNFRGVFQMKNKHSGKCLTYSGGVVVQADCNSNDRKMLWEVKKNHNSQAHKFVNQENGYCLAVINGVSGSQLILKACHGQDDSRSFYFNSSGGGYYIQSKKSQKCLDINNWSQDNGASAIQWDCHLGANQIFEFVTKDNNSSSPHARVCFYEHSDYTGESFCDDQVGFKNVPQEWNDRISSIRVYGNVKLDYYEHTNAEGNSQRIPKSSNVQHLQDWNDMISSYRIVR